MKEIKKNKSIDWKDKMNEKGSITIFLTLLIVVLLTTFLATIEIVRYEQAKGRCGYLAVGAVEHIMADYDVELAKRYHLYVLDKTYLGQGEETGVHRIWNYLEQNMNSIDFFGCRKGLYFFDVIDVQLEPQTYLYRKGCQSLKEQIHNWFIHSMLPTHNRILRNKQKHSVKEQRFQQNRSKLKVRSTPIICEKYQERKAGYIRQNRQWNKKQYQKNILWKKKKNNIWICKSKKLSGSKPSGNKPSRNKPSGNKPSTNSPVNSEQDKSVIQELLKKLDPRQDIEKIKRNGILSVASNSYLPLSITKTEHSKLPSATLKWEGDTKSLLEKASNRIELETYIFQHFNSALSTIGEEETVYQNEIEYLITGKQSDYDCLEMVAREITAMRSILNYTSIQRDKNKVNKVRNIATIICTILEQPEAIDVVTQGILMAWVFGESVADVKCLLQGDRVPMVKEPKDWHLSFHQLFYIQYVSVKGSRKGETYEDYLKKLLLLISEKNLYMRMLDLIELNVALQEPEFYIQNGMTKWKVDIQIEADVRLFQLPMARRNSYLFSISKVGEYQF